MREKGLTPLFQSPYSPDFNPIEHVFSQLKTAYRAMHGIDDIDARVQKAFDTVTSAALQNSYAHCWTRALTEGKSI